MPDSPPSENPSAPPQPQLQPQPNESLESDSQIPNPDTNPNPNPNPDHSSDSEDPSQNPKPSSPETQNPPQENPSNLPEEQPHVVDDDQELQDDPEPDPEPETENDHPEGMNVSVSSHHPSGSSDTHTIAQEIKGSNNPSASSRRTSKRKKGFKTYASKVAFEKKITQLSQGFNPIPFVPRKALDFSRHEELLKKLGLWDFAHLEFDNNIRSDLIVKLIVNYNQKNRGSYVDESKVGVSRADLGRALKLPKKLDCDVDSFPAEFLSFLDEFVTNWMILHEDEDLWCMPQDIAASTKLIRDGTPQKVDWAGLIWIMVEKELAQKATLKDCYYASHLQLMIKSQREELFRVSPNMEVENLKAEGHNLEEAVIVEDDEDGGDAKMMDFEESASAGQKLEDQNVELRLGQDSVASVESIGDGDEVKEDSECLADEKMEKVEDFEKVKEEDNFGISGSVDEGNKVESVDGAENVDQIENIENSREENKGVDMMEFEDDMGEEQGQGQWLLDNKFGPQHFLQRCSMAGANVSEVRGFEGVAEDVEDDEMEGDGHVEGFKIMPKSPLNGMTSTNLMQAFQTGQLPYSAELGGQSSLELMSSRAHNDVMLGAPSMFNHVGKREIDHEHEHDISHHALNGNSKRMRLDGNWEDKPHEFNFCLEQVQYWAEKAKISHATEKNEDQQASMAQQLYTEQQLSEKDYEIMHLNSKLGDLEKRRQTEVDRRDRELYLMSTVIDGYRRALKQTQKAFADYRKRCKIPDEPIYKDAGLGGVVKSVMELEKEQLKREEENKVMCSLIEETFWKNLEDLEVKWESEVFAKFQSHDNRLVDAAKEVELLKDRFRKRAMSANIQTELQGPSE